VLRIVGLCGSPKSPSRTRTLVQTLVEGIGLETNLPTSLIDLSELVSELGIASRDQASARLERTLKEIETASLLIVGTPIYKGSYTGLLKHLIDLLDYPVLLHVPVGLVATGGSERHALAVEHQLRPLFGFFCARTLPTGVFVSERDLGPDGRVSEPVIRLRLEQLAGEAVEALRDLKLRQGLKG
jgi:FMN reductase